jgi:hypothetical protein
LWAVFPVEYRCVAFSSTEPNTTKKYVGRWDKLIYTASDEVHLSRRHRPRPLTNTLQKVQREAPLSSLFHDLCVFTAVQQATHEIIVTAPSAHGTGQKLVVADMSTLAWMDYLPLLLDWDGMHTMAYV